VAGASRGWRATGAAATFVSRWAAISVWPRWPNSLPSGPPSVWATHDCCPSAQLTHLAPLRPVEIGARELSSARRPLRSGAQRQSNGGSISSANGPPAHRPETDTGLWGARSHWARSHWASEPLGATGQRPLVARKSRRKIGVRAAISGGQWAPLGGLGRQCLHSPATGWSLAGP